MFRQLICFFTILSIGMTLSAQEYTPRPLHTDLNSDGRYVAQSYDDHKVVVTNIETGQVVFTQRYDMIGTPPIAWSPANPSLLAIGEHPNVRLYDVETAEVVAHLPLNDVYSGNRYLSNLAWNPDGTMIAAVDNAIGTTGADLDYLVVWDVAQSVEVVQTGLAEITDLSWSGDGLRIAIFSAANEARGIYVLDVVGDQQAKPLISAYTGTEIAWSPSCTFYYHRPSYRVLTSCRGRWWVGCPCVVSAPGAKSAKGTVLSGENASCPLPGTRMNTLKQS